MFRSSVSSDVSSVIWGWQREWDHCLRQAGTAPYPIPVVAKIYPALQAVAVESQLVTLLLHLLEFALQLLDLFLQQSGR